MTLVNNLSLHNWNISYLKKDISLSYGSNIYEVLNNVSYVLRVSSSIVTHLEAIQNRLDLTIKEMLINYCDTYYEKEVSYEKMLDEISIDLFESEFIMFDKMIGTVSTVDELLKYQVKKDTVIFIAKEVLRLISLYKEVKIK